MEIYQRPQLRRDLELLFERPEEPAAASLYDPARRELYDLAIDDLPVLRLLDGTRTPREIARQAGRPLHEIHELIDDLADLLLLEDPDQAGLLKTWHRQAEQEDEQLQPVLDSEALDDLAGRPIQVVDDARHSCLHCGACCHYAVPISPGEQALLEEVPWPAEVVPEEAGRLFQVRPGLQWGRLESVIATRSDPIRCAFLDEENLCRVHQRLGAAAKPFACRLFPLAFPIAAPDRVIVSLTFECPTIYETYDGGGRLADRRAELQALVEEMEQVYRLPETIPLEGGLSLPLSDYLAWETELLADLPSPASDPAAFLERLVQRWSRIAPDAPPPLAGPEELRACAAALLQAARENRDTLAETPEGREGAAWAVGVLQRLAADPQAAWAPLSWEDGPAADRFLRRFVRHFVEGKQHLFYRSLRLGLRAMALLLLLARCDAAALSRGEGEEAISLGQLNRALARWSRLAEVRPMRMVLVGP